MTFRSLLISSATITRETAGDVDDYGNPVIEWTEVAAGVPCRVFQQNGDELTEDRDTVQRRATVYLEAGADVSPLDRIDVDGVTWEVDGPPLPAVGSVALHHFEVPVRQVTL